MAAQLAGQARLLRSGGAQFVHLRGRCVESLPRELTAELSTSVTLMSASAAPPAVHAPFHPTYTPVAPAAAPPGRKTPVRIRLDLQQRAATNLRRHMVRALRRFAVLVMADLASFYVMREVVRTVREYAWLGDRVAVQDVGVDEVAPTLEGACAPVVAGDPLLVERDVPGRRSLGCDDRVAPRRPVCRTAHRESCGLARDRERRDQPETMDGVVRHGGVARSFSGPRGGARSRQPGEETAAPGSAGVLRDGEPDVRRASVGAARDLKRGDGRLADGKLNATAGKKPQVSFKSAPQSINLKKGEQQTKPNNPTASMNAAQRDERRNRLEKRSRQLLVTEIQSVESLFASTPKNAPTSACAGRMPTRVSGIGAMITSGVTKERNQPTTST